MSKSAADGRRKKLERLGVKRRRLRKKTSRGGRIMHTLVRVQSRLELFKRLGEQPGAPRARGQGPSSTTTCGLYLAYYYKYALKMRSNIIIKLLIKDTEERGR